VQTADLSEVTVHRHHRGPSSRATVTRHLALGNVTVVDFYADWCPACRYLSPSLEEMARTDPEIALREIDVVNGRRRW